MTELIQEGFEEWQKKYDEMKAMLETNVVNL